MIDIKPVIMDLSLRILILIHLSLSAICFGQKSNAVQWQFSAETLPNNEVIVNLTAGISPGWHLYSQFIEEGGPIPTSLIIASSSDFVPIGVAEEKGNAVKFQDKIYDMEITWFSGTVSFLQRIRLNQPVTIIKGRVEYMTCNNNICIPDKQEFTIDIKPSKINSAKKQ